jgi:hypothetical protein
MSIQLEGQITSIYEVNGHRKIVVTVKCPAKGNDVRKMFNGLHLGPIAIGQNSICEGGCKDGIQIKEKRKGK